ncbi:hypothetical protein L596_023459 [Steinernema carpocapsae]|uniref:Uncharacterized protein n=1 Tax=Steinernema carpocapsae TaxID=34508 RepID=A0A4U5MEH1_STECR|nr:hypothetical protein L596_023459 [Steinernema carpocapsae]
MPSLTFFLIKASPRHAGDSRSPGASEFTEFQAPSAHESPPAAELGLLPEDLPSESFEVEASTSSATLGQETTFDESETSSLQCEDVQELADPSKIYILTWKFFSYAEGNDVQNVKPQVIDCFGVYKDATSGASHVVRSEKAVIPTLNHLKISMVKMSKQMDWSEMFDPEINYEARIPARMSIFDVLMTHVPSGDFKEPHFRFNRWIWQIGGVPMKRMKLTS